MTLHDRIIEISKAHGLSHLGSCLTAVGIIDSIYAKMRPQDKFVLSCGHAGLALYVCLEKYFGKDAEQLLTFHGIHPNKADKIEVSTGSLGQGLPIALGMAMANKDIHVHCLISDGEAYEGTIWECSNIIQRFGVSNLTVHVNFNGWSAYNRVPLYMAHKLEDIFTDIKIHHTSVEDYGFKGQEAHYIKCE